VEEGLDEAEVKSLLSSDQYAVEVRLDEREAGNYGVTGVPFFVLAGRYAIPGAVPTEEMKKLLQKAFAEQAQTATPAGMHCGPEGCSIR
jgi:predicted DsbA family dithiol-disulfide isomerase